MMNGREKEFRKIVELIESNQKKMAEKKSLLVGISGIDASGKGFITTKLAKEFSVKNINVANINIDGWLNLPHVRFDHSNPAENFYRAGIRFDEMFEKLVFPLRDNCSVKLTADFAEETAREFRQHEYFYNDIDIILLEGIFLFKNEFKNFFDLKIWIECSFETSLKRAIGRSQENLSPEETIRAYETIYFPAQNIHFQKDMPKRSADLIFVNE